MSKSKKKGGYLPYKKGARYENETAQWYRDRGWLVVRQAGSAFPDLICLSQTWEGPHLVECKLGGRLSTKEREQLVELAAKYRAVPVFANGKTNTLTRIHSKNSGQSDFTLYFTRNEEKRNESD